MNNPVQAPAICRVILDTSAVSVFCENNVQYHKYCTQDTKNAFGFVEVNIGLLTKSDVSPGTRLRVIIVSTRKYILVYINVCLQNMGFKEKTGYDYVTVIRSYSFHKKY